MAIKQTLIELGLNKKEVDVYLILLKNGSKSPAEISKLTKINRATVYNLCRQLQKFGLVEEETGVKKTTFIPLPPKNLEKITKEELKKIEEKSKLIQRAISEISLIKQDNEYPVPKIRFVEEKNVESFIYENMSKWVESLKENDKTWWGTQDSTFSENFDEFTDWYWKQEYAKEIKMFLISNDTPTERKVAQKHRGPNRDVRFSKNVDVTSSVWVGGDYLIMIVTNKKPFYLLEIHDKTLAHNMRESFKTLWRTKNV